MLIHGVLADSFEELFHTDKFDARGAAVHAEIHRLHISINASSREWLHCEID